MEYKLDLHTHSIISYDGGISLQQYRKFLLDKNFAVAVTDHNEISFAQKLHQEFPEQVIVGEETLTAAGEIIGLFLSQLIPRGLSVEETIRAIRAQNGLVYIPHPLEFRRKGVSMEILEKIAGSTDIIEVFNARNIEPLSTRKSAEFASAHNLAPAASSDAHSASGLGSSYSVVAEKPTRESLAQLLKTAQLVKNRAPLRSFLAPAYNKLKKKFRS